MPSKNQPLPTPLNPESNEGAKTPEAQKVSGPETSPEMAPKPVNPEKPVSEQFSDQATKSPTPPLTVGTPNNEKSVQVASAQVPVSEDDEAAAGVSEMDQAWVNTVDTVIENDKDKPYEEEEDSEKLQINYLSKRFGKKIDKE